MPKVSVIIPTRNRAGFLGSAIRSVLSQTFDDLEIVVVDDASADQTMDVVRGFGDVRVRYIRHQTNKGQGATRNDGIKQAAGAYIAFLDDDDEWLPGKLEKQVKLLDGSSPNVGLIYTGFYRVEGGSKRIINEIIPRRRGRVYEDLCLNNWMGTCSTVLIRRTCFERTGLFDEELAAAADYDMWLRIAEEFEIDYVGQALVYYTVHDERISTNHESKIRGLEGLLRKHALAFGSHSKSYSRRYSSLGINYCFKGDIKKGQEALLRAIKLYPFEVRHYYNFCLSLLGPVKFRKLKKLRDRLGTIG